MVVTPEPSGLLLVGVRGNGRRHGETAVENLSLIYRQDTKGFAWGEYFCARRWLIVGVLVFILFFKVM